MIKTVIHVNKVFKKHNNQKEKYHLNEVDVSIRVQIGKIPSNISDTGATSIIRLQGDHFIINYDN